NQTPFFSTGSVFDQGVEVVLREPVAAVQERQLDDEAAADDNPAETLHQLPGDRLDRSACGEHVVMDEHARALRDHLGMQLELVPPVLERIARTDRLRRELARATCRNESATDLLRDCRAEDEPAGFGAKDKIRVLLRPPLRQPLDRIP